MSTKPPVAPVAQIKASPFNLSDVRLLDGPFREAMQRNLEYLLSLDSDRLLHTFRLNAGLPTTAQPYGGWEAPNCELRGHSLGHYLSACALSYASTGDERPKTRADGIVAELAKCQEALPGKGCNKGYLSAYPESFIDRVEACKGVWAPWYTLHKIMAGLLETHQLCGNRQALDILVKMASWIKFRMDRLAPEQIQRSLGNEFGGMNEVLTNLYAVTGDPEHLRAARCFDHKAIFDPLALGQDRLNGLHANTQIPKMIGAAREYEMSGETRYHDIAQFFWQRVALQRSYAIGGHSDGEHFFPIEQFSAHLSPETCETCNTYNMLKLTRRLFGWEPSAETMDFYERALYNHILASQDPDKGMFVYLMSLKPGHFKTYSTPDNSFWCCVGTGMENHAKYGDTIYYHDGKSLYVNLFIASELNWREKGLAVRQETKFPEQDTSKLIFKCRQPVTLGLRVRWPAWAGAGGTPAVRTAGLPPASGSAGVPPASVPGLAVTINGEKVPVVGNPGSYITLEREWKDGDTVELKLPLFLRLETLPNSPNIVALLYGPLVLAGELGTEGLEHFEFHARGQCDHVHVPTPDVPVFFGEAQDLLAKVVPVAGKPLTFQTQGLGKPRDVSLVPFYRLHYQRYSVYWNLYTAEQWAKKQAELAAAEARRKELERRIVDAVHPGEQQSETDHKRQGERDGSGTHQGRKWRHAPDGGWFSYELKVLPDQPMSLLCTYWGSDSGRTFDVLVDTEKVATQTLENCKPGEFFDVECALPEQLTKGKERVTVKFQGHPGNTAGGVFGCMMLKKGQQQN
ncbi:MAG: beta-L-arabinofuranosidase domain-containing protein [Planctomycetota bacterium]